jgi:hypothetical protein
MIEEKSALLRTDRNNVHRYRRLLKTELTELERRLIEKRLSKEQSAIATIATSWFPFTFEIAVPAVQETQAPEAMSSHG